MRPEPQMLAGPIVGKLQPAAGPERPRGPEPTACGCIDYAPYIIRAPGSTGPVFPDAFAI